MDKVLAIFGAGGQGKEVYEIIVASNSIKEWKEILFIDDVNPEGMLMDRKRLHLDNAIKMYGKECLRFVVALGDPIDKKKIFFMLKNYGLSFTNVIDSDARVSSFAKLGKGLIIKKGVIISPEVQIGDNTTLQAYVTVGHGVFIGEHSQISTHCAIGGESRIGSSVFIGLNVPVKEKTIIGDDTIISAGAVVLKDIEKGMVVMGNPARVIAKNDKSGIFN